MMEPIKGFSKLSKEAKLQWLTTNNFEDSEEAQKVFRTYWHEDGDLQKKHDEFIENTMTNYFMPYGVAPNFEINGKLHTIPMAIEESSVVAAASKSASYWKERGGFKVEVISTEKIGHVHFMYEGDATPLFDNIHLLEEQLRAVTAELTANMESRGGGITSITLVDKRPQLAHYFQLEVCFETCDSMGANFINSNLEVMAGSLEQFAKDHVQLEANKLEVVMRILSNYTPHCIVKASVSCPIAQLESEGISAAEFARKFKRAIDIANVEPYRATTHNKGIMNGIDAVILATGNDFRAVEAAVHAYACKDGQYSSLTHASIENDIFKMWIELPLALGTVGGLTSLHPLVGFAFDLLQKPNAKKLMQLVAVAGLAQNFAALRSLVTTGIQKGHMKMHLMNILNGVQATDAEKALAVTHFTSHQVSHSAVIAFVEQLRA